MTTKSLTTSQRIEKANQNFEDLKEFVTGNTDQLPPPGTANVKERLASAVAIGISAQAERLVTVMNQLSLVEAQLLDKAAHGELNTKQLLQLRESLETTRAGISSRTVPNINGTDRRGNSVVQQVIAATTSGGRVDVPRAESPLRVDQRDRITALGRRMALRLQERANSSSSTAEA